MSTAASLKISAESLEQLRPLVGVPTGVEVIDDFLLWRGIPKGDLTVFQSEFGQRATSLWRHMMDHLLKEKRKTFWIQSFDSSELNYRVLQDLIRNSFFEVLTVSVNNNHFNPQELQKTRELAQKHKVSVIFICPAVHWSSNSYFSLVIDCDFDFFTIKKALHRPTPFFIHNSLMTLGMEAIPSPILEDAETISSSTHSNPLTLWHQKRPEWLGQC